MKLLAASLALAVSAGGLAACSSGAPHTRTVTLARDLTVTLPPGSPTVTARRAPTAIRSSLVKLLATPEHLTAAGRLPGKAVLTFHVGHVPGRPFLAWLDNGQWVPVASSYNATAGTVRATVSHFSIWGAFTWEISQIKAGATSAVRDVFGLGTASEPNCGTAGLVKVTDSNPSHHTVGACAAQAAGLPAGHVLTKIVNLRDYPIDLSYPSSLGKRCGSYGKCLQLTSQGDPWLKLGAALSRSKNSVLLPGDATATAITYIPSGKSAQYRTVVDIPATNMAALEVGVNLLVFLAGLEYKAAAAAAATIDVLQTSTCLSRQAPGPLTIPSTRSLEKAAFGCIATVIPDALDKLGLKKVSFLTGAFNLGSSLASADVSVALWGPFSAILSGLASTHSLTVNGVSAPAPNAHGPTPSSSQSVSPTPPSSPTSVTVRVTIPANAGWVDTGLSLNLTDSVDIAASGSWTPGGGSYTGPGGFGYSTLSADNYINLSDLGVCGSCATSMYPEWAALMSYTGSNPPQPGSYTSTAVAPQAQLVDYVGSSLTTTKFWPYKGELWLGINDDAYSGNTSDNYGQVTATITITRP